MEPAGRRWNLRADFEQIVLRLASWVTDDQFAAAIAVGDQFFAASDSTPGYGEYHRVILRELEVEATPCLLSNLRRPVPPAAILQVFPDVRGTLRELQRRGVRMAVVSDSWPGLPELHACLGIGEFFEAYAISVVLGCRKPDPRMYRHASDALGLDPAQCLFVDDDPDLVAAAIGLGYDGRAVYQAGSPPPGCDVPAIASPDELILF